MNKHPLGAHGFNIFAFASQSKHGHNGATKSPRSNLKRRFFGCGQCVYDGCSGEVTDKSPGKRSQQSKFKCMLNTGRVQNLHIPWPGHRLARRPHDFPFRRPNCQRKILDVAADECPTSGRILDSPTIRTLAPSSKSSRTCLACKGFTGTTRRRCTRQHPGTKRAPRLADKNADKPVTNSGFCSPVGLFRVSLVRASRVTPRKTFFHRLGNAVVSWANRHIGVLCCPSSPGSVWVICASPNPFVSQTFP